MRRPSGLEWQYQNINETEWLAFNTEWKPDYAARNRRSYFFERAFYCPVSENHILEISINSQEHCAYYLIPFAKSACVDFLNRLMQSVQLALVESLQKKMKHTRYQYASDKSSVQKTGIEWTERELEAEYEIEEKLGLSDGLCDYLLDYFPEDDEHPLLEKVKDMEALYSPFSDSYKEYGVPYQLYDGGPAAQELIRQQKKLIEQMRKTLKAFECCE